MKLINNFSNCIKKLHTSILENIEEDKQLELDWKLLCECKEESNEETIDWEEIKAELEL